ncbi:MAG TPA: SIR2 family protein [Candidatus Cloacimonadota bacterium]|nr:SIR2 family protein [Candidatus Cloacimonadota bacterium]
MTKWGNHVLKVGPKIDFNAKDPDELTAESGTDTETLKNQLIDQYRKSIEPWLSSLFQSEHLSLLIGSGFTTAIANMCSCTAQCMGYDETKFPESHREILDKHTKETARILRFSDPNIEDQIRVLSQSIDGLEALGDSVNAISFKTSLNDLLSSFLKGLLETECGIGKKLFESIEESPINTLIPFLMSFASRAASRERLNLFTTNYDRLIELGCDAAGIRVLDRFIGGLEPVFRSSRLDIDMHYNPPGIRGEPRYLEGVVRLTKLHGSLDWRYDKDLKVIRKVGLPFGVDPDMNPIPTNPANSVMIYPNPMKDRETAEYPYVELFRDFAAAVCKPNATLVTYGYGFGDDHINRIISDMLTIPSTHLLIISYDKSDDRITKFYQKQGFESQISLMIGSHFGDISKLVEHYLPKPSIDRISSRMFELLSKRNVDIKNDAEVVIPQVVEQDNNQNTSQPETKLSTLMDKDIPF